MKNKIDAYSINLKELKKYTYFYIIALTLIAVLMVVANIYIQESLSEQLIDSEIINRSARQHTLNQSIINDLLLIRYDLDRSVRRTVNIKNAFKEWQMNDSLLNHNNDFSFVTEQNQRYTISLYGEVGKLFKQQEGIIEQFLEDIYYERYESEDTLAIWDARFQELLRYEERYQANVDDITYRYATESKQKTSKLKSISGNLLNVILIILLIEAFLIFKPIISQFWYALEQLNEKSAKLSKANEDNTKIFKIIAHDLKNQIAASISNNDMIIEYYDQISTEKLFSLVTRLRGTLQSLNDILNNLLVWSLSQNMELKPKYENFNIKLLANEIINQVSEHATIKQIKLIQKISDTIITADRNMITVIIRNLVMNAIKYCKANDVVEIVFEDHATYYNIIIYDTGVGMDSEKLKKLFHDNTESAKGTRNEKGTGLGLKICREFAELHKGKIIAESTLGIGTKILVTIPKYRKTPMLKLSI